MKIQLLSDLHLESQPWWQPTPADQADLLVLAGDIGSSQNGSRLDADDFGLSRFSPCHGWPTPVVFVPGNHEYDNADFDVTHDRLRSICEQLGIVWLERETFIWPGLGQRGQQVRFIGTTLWTDFDALGVHAALCGNAPTSASLVESLLKARGKASRAADYYLKKTGTTWHDQPMESNAVRAQALVCQQWLVEALSSPFDGDTVVVTHFAPSLYSADPRYGKTPGTAGFCNALDPLLAHASLWLHGHLHAPSNYVHNGCRVVANPLGYMHKGEDRSFNPLMSIFL